MVVASIVAVVAVYFAVSAFILPPQYLTELAPPRPAPVITNVTVSDQSIVLGQTFTLYVNVTNRGEHADWQLVSIAFPNATDASVANIVEHTFKQTPRVIKIGQMIGAGYVGPQREVVARYPAIEAASRPWEPGESFAIKLSVKPEVEGRFMVFVKSVGLPHNYDQAHDPQSGVIDQQDEYVYTYGIDVTKA